MPLRNRCVAVTGLLRDRLSMGPVIDQEAPMKLSLVISAVVALALSASAAARVLPGFNSPTGNIKCYYNPHGLSSRGVTPVVRCGLDHADYAMQLQRRCDAGDWHGFILTPTGRPGLYCAGGASGDRVAYKTLAYGKARQLGPFTCTSRITGVTCRNRAGHGLFVSRQTYRTW
jgi:hypothetical protein